MIRKLTASLLTSVAVFLLVSVSVLAQNTNSRQEIRRPMGTELPRQAASPSPERLRACEANIHAVRTRSQNVVRQGKALTDRLTAIELRVDEYYGKALLRGAAVPDYEDLIDEIHADRRQIERQLQAVEQASYRLNCEGSPRQTVSSFSTEARELVSLINEYKASVRKLTAAVHEAVVEAE